MPHLKLENLRKSFGNDEVIHGVDLTVEKGEFVVFVGPSGCGKSTLLRMIAGLESATAGRIEIGGKDVTHTDPAKRGVAMVFQSYALFPHMTVRDNIGFGMRVNKVDKNIAAGKIARAAEILQLDALLDRKPAQLSGGQRQRVAIGRAIVREPDVFLFDEPLSNLDAELRVQMRIELAALHSRLDATMVYVTHDQVEAMTLADKIVILRAGTIEQIGSPLQLYDNPDNLFVAGFLGSPKMNFFNAKNSGNRVLQLTDYDAALPLPAGIELSSTELVIGCRPERFDPDALVKLSVRIDALENLGSTTFAYARERSGEPLAVELRDGRALKAGDTLEIGLNPDRLMYFDKQSGLRLRAEPSAN